MQLRQVRASRVCRRYLTLIARPCCLLHTFINRKFSCVS